MKTIDYDPIDSEYIEVLMIDKIVRLTKQDENITCIHLIGGEKILSNDSIKTLQARIESVE